MMLQKQYQQYGHDHIKAAAGHQIINCTNEITSE